MRGSLVVFCAIAALSLLECNRSQHPESFPIQGAIIHYIQRNCSASGPCTIRIRDLTNFDWEKMYVFALGTSPSDRERVIGQHGVETVDLEGELVFTKAGQIVHQEPVPEGVELPLRNEIAFVENTNSDGYVEYSPNTIFSVTIDESKNGKYFVLDRAR